jgi:uncharacterized protein (DUF58 family)
MIRPTGRAVALGALVFVGAALLALLAPEYWAFGPIAMLVLVLAAATDGVLAPRPSEVSTTVSLPAALAVGAAGEGDLTLSFGGTASSTSFRAQADVDGGLDPIPELSGTVAARGSRRLSLPLRAARRGTARIVGLTLLLRGPLGLAARVVRRAVDAGTRVMPNIGAVRDLALETRLKDMTLGLKTRPFMGDGSEFQALREFVNGMDPRAMDWVRSARHRKLISKEFEAERNNTVIVAYDLGRVMSEQIGGITRLDHAINAGLLLSYLALRGGDRVGVLGFDSQVRAYCPPIQGVHSMPYVQQTTAELVYGEEETNFTLGLAELSARLNRRALIVLMTDFTDSIAAELMLENVARLTRNHLVVFVTLTDPELVEAFEKPPETLGDVTEAVIADEFLRERRIVLERLRRLGVDVLSCSSEAATPMLIERYLDIKARTRM